MKTRLKTEHEPMTKAALQGAVKVKSFAERQRLLLTKGTPAGTPAKAAAPPAGADDGAAALDVEAPMAPPAGAEELAARAPKEGAVAGLPEVQMAGQPLFGEDVPGVPPDPELATMQTAVVDAAPLDAEEGV